jgi:hypothetical protein
MKERPKCRRCGGPLDVGFVPAIPGVRWWCNNPTPLSDEGFWKWWNNLSGDEIVELQKMLDEKGET